jgi:hypothetical protein
MGIPETAKSTLLSEESQSDDYIKKLSELKSQQQKMAELQMNLHQKEIAKRIKIYKILITISLIWMLFRFIIS